jgi:Tfp pilus assembly protein FimT
MFKFNKEGFTVLEIILIIGILGIIFAIGLPVTFDFYQNYQLQAEQNKFISLLEIARNSAMINLNQSSHGVYWDNDNLIIFEGNDFATRNQNQDQNFPRTKAISISGTNEITFGAISGQTASSVFVFNNGDKSSNVYVNQEGQINWQ